MHEDLRTAWTPQWREMLTGVQWLRLRRSAVYRGEGVPRGDGAPVLLVQGFLTRPLYLGTLRAWLERLGYRVRVADVGWNADCYDVVADRVMAEVESLSRDTQRRVHLVGHSLGGILVRSVAARAPQLVASVATLATPFRGLRVHPTLRLGNIVVRTVVHGRRDPSVFPECMTLACQCATVRALAAPLPASLPQLAIAAPGDGVADWRYEADPATTRTIEVPGSHTGVVFERRVYEALAPHLAAAAATGDRVAS
jgi:triacylglycerol lipase